MLHDLPLNHPIHVLGSDRDRLARWRDILKRACLGATIGRTKGDAIPFGNHLINRDPPIRKGSLKGANKAFERCSLRGQIVADKLVAMQFIEDGQVLLIDHLFIEAADGGLVLFAGHVTSSFVCVMTVGKRFLAICTIPTASTFLSIGYHR